MSAVVGSELNLSKILIDSLAKPFVIFLGVSVAFSYVISLFLSNGNTNVVNIRKPTISLGDPTLGLVVMCVVNAVFTILYWKMLSRCWQDVKLHTMEVLTSVQETVSGLGKSIREMGTRFMSKTRVGNTVGNTVNNIAGNRSAGGSEVSTSAVQRSKNNKVTNVDSKSKKVQSTDSQFSSKSTKESKAKEEQERKKSGVKTYDESMQNTQKRTGSVQNEVAERNVSKRIQNSSDSTTVNSSRTATVNHVDKTTLNQATSSTNNRVSTENSYINIGEKYRNKDVPKTNNGDGKNRAMADRLKKS